MRAGRQDRKVTDRRRLPHNASGAMDRDPFDLAGDVLDGQFRVDEFAGEGDLSVVYKGHHLGVDAPVAIKCLNLPSTLDPALARPLIESFREASRVHYKLARGNLNIAQSIASGTTIAPRTGATVPYLVREWYEGESLAADLARRRVDGLRGRSVQGTLALLEPAVDGIAYAHEQGVVHLSVNPSNLFLARVGDERSLKVLDFGVARTMNELSEAVPPESRRGTGLRVLFPSYAAPEQLDKNIGPTGPWTDVYALALLMMEVLSDRIVMESKETGALVERALDEKHRPAPRTHGLMLPRNLDIVLTRAVTLAPDKRQKSAGDLWKDVKAAVRETGSRSMGAARPDVQPPGAQAAPAAASLPSTRLKTSTLMGIGVSTKVAGAVKPGPLAPTHAETRPQAFEVTPPPPPIVEPPPEAPAQPKPFEPRESPPASAIVSGAAKPQTITERLPPPPPAPVRFRIPGAPLLPILLLRGRWRPPRLILYAVGGGVLLVLLVVVIVVAASSGGHAKEGVSSASVPVPGPAPPPSSAESPPMASAPSHPATRGFTTWTAKRALDGTAADVGRCRRGDKWGVASATVTFANDGSVQHVSVGVPFTGTPTGQCVADALGAVHIPSFGGRPGVLVYRFFVAP
jgi:serine/threonine protein kinase